MAQIGRPGLSAVQKEELWRRWKDGQSRTEIGLALEKHAGSVHGVLKARGGIAPLAKTRSERCLNASEREEISRGLVAGLSLRRIAEQICRAPSTISREVGRNGGRHYYRAASADERAWKQAERPKSCYLARHARLRNLVAEKLKGNWLPQQIAGGLEAEFGEDPSMRVSHETIYRSLFIQARGTLKRELFSHLRSRRIMRRGKTATTEGQAAVRSLTRSPFANVRPSLRIAPFPATGRETCYRARRTAA